MVEKLVADLVKRMELERARLQPFREVFESSQASPPVPRDAEREKKALARLARTPWLRLVVASTVQPLKVTGYRNAESGENSLMWDVWMRNDMDSRQIALHYDVAKFGYAYVQVTPGEDPVTGEPMAVMRPVSPQRSYFEYDDPFVDEYPIHGVRRVSKGRFKYIDAEAVWTLTSGDDGESFHVEEVVEHGASVCPVVLLPNHMDTEGRCFGEIEPYMDVASRLDLTINDRLLVQRHNSWKILYATDLEPPKGTTAAQKENIKLKLRNDTVLTGGKGVKFGTLDETNMNPFIAAADDDRNALSAVTQTPLSMLTGEMINLGADAITTSYRPWREKLGERARLWGDAYARMFRAAAQVMGETAEVTNYSARVVFQDVEDRSLAQTADAFGKLCQMLEVPPEVLWPRIPGVEQSDLAEWHALHQTRQAEKLQTEAMMSGLTELRLDYMPTPKAKTGDSRGPQTPATYEDQPKPWGAKRGPRMTKGAALRRKRKRDGDGDGILDE